LEKGGIDMAKTINQVLKPMHFHKRIEMKNKMIAGMNCSIPTYCKVADLKSIPSPYEREGIVRLLKEDILFGNEKGEKVVHKFSIHDDEFQMIVSDLIKREKK
jgi:hypothetical protein